MWWIVEKEEIEIVFGIRKREGRDALLMHGWVFVYALVEV